jgi:hypothetical protein
MRDSIGGLFREMGGCLIQCATSKALTQIPKFGIVLVVVLVLGALGFRGRK